MRTNLIGKLIAAIALALLLGVSPAQAALTTPSVKAKAKKKPPSVTLSIRYTGVVKSDASIRIERSDGDKPFAPLAVVSQPRPKFSYKDSTAGGAVTYRVRLEAPGGATSPWATVSSFIAVPTPGLPCPDGYEAETLSRINDVRAANHVSPLKDNARLHSAAVNQNTYMIFNNKLTHTPAGFPNWAKSIKDSGYSGYTYGQNIAFGYTTPEMVVTGWVNSPEHFANILRTSFHDSGISCAVGPNGRMWWTHDFGG